MTDLQTKAQAIADRAWQSHAGEVAEIAAEIVALVEAERERCAGVCRKWAEVDPGSDGSQTADALARTILNTRS